MSQSSTHTHLGQSDLGAQVGLARGAELALAALGNVQRDDVVPHLDRGHPLANGLHHTPALMAQDAGELGAWGRAEGHAVRRHGSGHIRWALPGHMSQPHTFANLAGTMCMA